MTRIVTITLNPALDLTGNVDHLVAGRVNRVSDMHLRPAGKGINVALVARGLGVSVAATGMLGQGNQMPFVDLFEKHRIHDEFIREQGDTRINIKICEQSGQFTDINFPRLEISQENIDQLFERVSVLAQTCDVFVLAGSVPSSLSSSIWADLINLLKPLDKCILLDTSGKALEEGIAACPTLIKPNETELSELVGYACESRERQQQAAEELLSKGVENVVVSNGAEGVSWYSDSLVLHATPPPQKVVSTVGAGDSLVAGLAVGLSRMLDAETILRTSTAIATMAISQIGVGITNQMDFIRLKRKILISRNIRKPQSSMKQKEEGWKRIGYVSD